MHRSDNNKKTRRRPSSSSTTRAPPSFSLQVHKLKPCLPAFYPISDNQTPPTYFLSLLFISNPPHTFFLVHKTMSSYFPTPLVLVALLTLHTLHHHYIHHDNVNHDLSVPHPPFTNCKKRNMDEVLKCVCSVQYLFPTLVKHASNLCSKYIPSPEDAPFHMCRPFFPGSTVNRESVAAVLSELSECVKSRESRRSFLFRFIHAMSMFSRPQPFNLYAYPSATANASSIYQDRGALQRSSRTPFHNAYAVGNPNYLSRSVREGTGQAPTSNGQNCSTAAEFNATNRLQVNGFDESTFDFQGQNGRYYVLFGSAKTGELLSAKVGMRSELCSSREHVSSFIREFGVKTAYAERVRITFENNRTNVSAKVYVFVDGKQVRRMRSLKEGLVAVNYEKNRISVKTGSTVYVLRVKDPEKGGSRLLSMKMRTVGEPLHSGQYVGLLGFTLNKVAGHVIHYDLQVALRSAQQLERAMRILFGVPELFPTMPERLASLDGIAHFSTEEINDTVAWNSAEIVSRL